MTSAFPPQFAALTAGGIAQSALPHAPVLAAQPAKSPRRLLRRKPRISSPRNERPRESGQLAVDLQALVDAGLIEFHDQPGLRRYALSQRGRRLIEKRRRRWG
jgi:hypothetical protein